MKVNAKQPPRRFTVGKHTKIDMHDCASITLSANEQVTFFTESNAEYDVSRKKWGFYATPSLNGRLLQFGLRGVLIRNNTTGHYFVLLVEKGKEAHFHDYIEQEDLEIITWMDNSEQLDALAATMAGE